MEIGSGWREREPEVIGSKQAHTWASEKGKRFQVSPSEKFLGIASMTVLYHWKIGNYLPSLMKREKSLGIFSENYYFLLHSICTDHLLKGEGSGVLAADLAAWYLHAWEFDTDREENVECSAECLLKFN